MTPTELRDTLDRFNWSTRTFAAMLDCNPRTVSRWLSGQNPIPPRIAAWLDKWNEFASANCLPEEWWNDETN